MKKLGTLLWITAVLALLPTGAPAASTPWKQPYDTLQFGKSGSSANKSIVFDFGLGAANPSLFSDSATTSLGFSKNAFLIGDGLSSTKTITANLGLGASNPKLNYDPSTSSWAFSNDGTNFTPIGTGGGGAGVNLLTNGGFESGVTQDWTHTGGTFVSTSPLFGNKAAVFTASAGGQSFQSALHAPLGLSGIGCVGSFYYQGGDTNLSFEVLDDLGNVLSGPQVLQASTGTTPVALPFLCPAAPRTVQAKVFSSAAAAAITVDGFVLGQNSVTQLSQANFFGSASWIGASSATSVSVSGAPTDFANTGFTATLKGNLSAPASQLGFTANMPAGEYLIEVSGTFLCHEAGGQSIAECRFSLGDTANTPAGSDVGYLANNPTTSTAFGIGGTTFSYHLSYSTSATRTIRLMGDGGFQDTAFVASFGTFTPWVNFKVYRFPTQSEQAVRADTVNWKVDAVQSGANVSLNTAIGTGGLTPMPGTASLAMTLNPGSVSAFTPCSGSQAPTGLTCATGNPEPGIAFNMPAAGDAEVCVNAVLLFGFSATTVLQETFDIAETSATSDTTYLQQGSLSVNVSEQSGAINSTSRPVAGCTTMHFASAGLKTVRMNYNYIISTNNLSQHLIAADGTAGRQIHWTVKPITQYVPAPVTVGGVITPSSGVKKIVAGYFAGGTSISACNSSPCTLYGAGNESITSVTRSSAGVYVINFAAGTFSAQPVCTCSPEAHVVNGCQFDFAGTTSSAAQLNTYSSVGTLTDGNAMFTCLGSK